MVYVVVVALASRARQHTKRSANVVLSGRTSSVIRTAVVVVVDFGDLSEAQLILGI